MAARVDDVDGSATTLLRSQHALTSRLRRAGQIILADDGRVTELAARGGGVLADALARSVQGSRRDDELWLLLVALTASFPEVDVLLRARRAMGLAAPEFALSALLECTSSFGGRLKALDYDMQIVTDESVVDVDFCARFDHNTGIQRVVRETMSRWNGVHPLVLTCWSAGHNALRELAPAERRRVVEWDAHKSEKRDPKRDPDALPEGFTPRLVVPWRTTLVLPEVAHEGLASRLACVARFSGNRVAMIGYDTIPIASADLIMSIESEKFAKYLTIVKHASRVVAISESAAEEFRGFVTSVSAQGVTGPVISAVTLAVQSPARGGEKAPVDRPAAAQKLVLMVGNQEPRKNLLAVLFAAETLWREGLQFRLRMIGGGRPDYARIIDREAARLSRAGYAIEVLRGAPDSVLVDSYQSAHFTIFPSTHEGYGLPVAESLAMGVPSITSDFGSTQQIADGGGCLTVDPRNDTSIEGAMRRLLIDDDEHHRLALEARARQPRSWNDYASELWNELVQPLEATV